MVSDSCVLPPSLFNLFSKEVFSITLPEVGERIKTKGSILNIRYADVLDIKKVLQSLLAGVSEARE